MLEVLRYYYCYMTGPIITYQYVISIKVEDVFAILRIKHNVFDWLCFSSSLQWRYNGRDGVSNHQPHDYLLNRLLRHRSKKTSKLRVIGLCAWNSPVTGELPAQMASDAEYVSIWWRNHYQYVYHYTNCIRNTSCGDRIWLSYNGQTLQKGVAIMYGHEMYQKSGMPLISQGSAGSMFNTSGSM